MFAVSLHAKIYQAIADIHAEDKKLSTTLLCSRLPEEDDDGQNILAYVGTLVANSEGLSAEDFADEVAECAGRRQILKIAESAVKAAKAGTKPVIDIAASIEEATLDIIHKVSPKRPRLLHEIASEVTQKAITASKSAKKPGLSTGLASIDEITGQWLAGDLIFLLGSQGDGKSALAAQIAIHNSLDRDGPSGDVLLLQNEMTEEQTAAREIVARSGVHIRQLREGGLNLAEHDKIRAKVEELRQSRLWIMRDHRMTLRSIRNNALSIKRMYGLKLLVIDQLTHIRTDAKHRNKFDRYEEITSELKSLAFELDCPILVLVQRTRRAQRDEDPTPKIDDADAPSIERDGDMVLAVWRVETWLKRNKPNSRAGGEAMESWENALRRAETRGDIIGLKVRSGKPYQDKQLTWNGPMMRFSDFDPLAGEEPPF